MVLAAALIAAVTACTATGDRVNMTAGRTEDPQAIARDPLGSAGPPQPSTAQAPIGSTTTGPDAARGTTQSPERVRVASATATPITDPPPVNLYAETIAGKFAPQVRDVPARVYVPNSDAHSLTIIDPATGAVTATVNVGVLPHHVTPSWDLSTLYVLDTAGNALMPINPRTAEVGAPIPVEDPYNLYFTPDGTTALVIAERYQRIDARDPHTWALLWSVPVPHPGVNHGDFSADGRYFYASCEFSGWFVKIDLVEHRIVAEAKIGVEPIDTKFSPGRVGALRRRSGPQRRHRRRSRRPP